LYTRSFSLRSTHSKHINTDTGYRAALKAAGLDDNARRVLWDSLVGILELGNIKFEPDDKKGGESSKVSNLDICKRVEKWCGIKNLDKNLVIYRRHIRGKDIDSPVSAMHANDNRNALIKAFYGHIFHYLIDDVANKVLTPTSHGEGFVALLDIFGFEVFKRNSMEQLCINFANEKLQKLFNDHIFKTEEHIYDKEGIPKDCIPPYQDNTPCCNLIGNFDPMFGSVLRHLDDIRPAETIEENNKKDDLYCQDLINRWGRDSGPSTNKKLNRKQRKSSCYFHAQRGAGNKWFVISHFAGDVKYHVKGWVVKNHDKLPPQLDSMMKDSTNTFVAKLFHHGKGRIEGKTIAKQFVNNLSSLAKTLDKTTPNYVRCVKPNNIQFRPVDGMYFGSKCSLSISISMSFFFVFFWQC